MKKTLRLVTITAIIVLGLSLTACGKKNDNTTQTTSIETADSGALLDRDALIGTWKGTGNEISTVTIGKDGSFKDDAGDLYMIGTYTVNTVDRTITVNESEYGMVITYSVELSGDNLTIQTNGGLPRTFTKK